MSYGKYRIGVISLADYDSEDPSYSTVGEDFPFELGPLALYDTLSNLMNPWGRPPSTGEPLFVTEVDRYTGQITTHGVNSMGAYATPKEGVTPDGSITVCQVTNAAVIIDIENHAKHIVLGIDETDLQDSEAEMPAWMAPYYFDEPFPDARWDILYSGLLTIGVDQDVLDNWRDANPEGTPREFGEAYRNYLNQLIEAAG